MLEMRIVPASPKDNLTLPWLLQWIQRCGRDSVEITRSAS
jgi:hypothetical protein